MKRSIFLVKKYPLEKAQIMLQNLGTILRQLCYIKIRFPGSIPNDQWANYNYSSIVIYET